MKMFATISALNARVMAEQAFVLGHDANSRGEECARHYECAGSLVRYADQLEMLSLQCRDEPKARAAESQQGEVVRLSDLPEARRDPAGSFYD